MLGSNMPITKWGAAHFISSTGHTTPLGAGNNGILRFSGNI